MSDLNTFEKSFNHDAIKRGTGKIIYRSISDIDYVKQSARDLIKDKGLKLQVFSDSSLVQLKMFEIKEI